MPKLRAAAEKDPVSAVTKKARAWFQSKVAKDDIMHECITHK